MPPYWKIEPKEAVSVIGGQNVLIDCLAEGSPSPSVTWERGSNMDNSPLSSSPSGSSSPRYYSVISSGPHFEVYPNGSLLIKNSVEEDSGFYLCQASNSIGPGISKLLTLTVHGTNTCISLYISVSGDAFILLIKHIFYLIFYSSNHIFYVTVSSFLTIW